MGDAVTIEIKSEAVTRALQRLYSAGAEREPIHADIGRSLVSNIHLTMKAGTDPYGRPHAPLKYRDGIPLVSGNARGLVGSISSRADETDVVVGTNKVYAATQQFGVIGRVITPRLKSVLRFFIPGRGSPVFARSVKITIPPRPFLPMDGDLPGSWRRDILALIKDRMMESYNG
ncbi:MAG: phage virion morphogenesis protein [Nitrospinae bacterium]|nr:phage virion morphogenesis protein [Nitrospinota bacterium]